MEKALLIVLGAVLGAALLAAYFRLLHMSLYGKWGDRSRCNNCGHVSIWPARDYAVCPSCGERGKWTGFIGRMKFIGWEERA